MPICDYCGCSVAVGKLACQNCGAPQPHSAQPDPPPPPPYYGPPPQPYYGPPPQPYYGPPLPYYGPPRPYLGPTGGVHPAAYAAPAKSHSIALVLCMLFGSLGVHRFYMGKIGTGVLMLFTLGMFGIWTGIDLLVLCFGNMNDSNGVPLADKNWALSIVILIVVFIVVVAVASSS